MAESKKEKPIFCEDETEKNDKPLNEHVSDFEGKLIVDELSLENDFLENTDESAANVVYHQQYDNNITEKTESFVYKKKSSETICSSIESFSDEACKEKTCSSYKFGIGEHRTAKETLCEPCSNEDIHVSATHFCKTCDDHELLCESCAKHHIRQKICRNHQICENIREFPNKKPNKCENVTANEALCEPCSNEDIHVSATHFCKTCDDPEPLCESCAKHHIRQKICRDHQICENIREFMQKEEHFCKKSIGQKMVCEPCFAEDLQVQATQFCKTCDDPEPLCETCAKHHLRQKISRNHELCGNIREFRFKEPQDCQKTPATEVLCEPCSIEYLHSPATHFCLTCDDPEPLCKTCAKHHLRQKLSKSHEMCSDIEMYRNRERKGSGYKSGQELFCEPCSTEDLQVQATHFCKTCDDPEPLCETCAKHHTKQKLSKYHELCGDIRELQKTDLKARNKAFINILCETCSTEDLQVRATCFCKTCDDPEPLCETCAKHHTKQKLSRNHQICGDIREYQTTKNKACKDEEANKLLCEPCSTENFQAVATHFCETCDDPEPLCETCAKHHRKQRLYRDHQTSGDIRKFKKMKLKSCKYQETKKLICKPCYTENILVLATHFCKTCDDPEPLCKTCAKHHTKQRFCRNHQISEDIWEFQEVKQKTCKDEVTTKILCEPCSTEDLQIQATHFCKTCENPEPLCETCAKNHTKQKLCRDHQISGDVRELQKIKHNDEDEKTEFCEPCLTENLQVQATNFCKTCDDPEPLCETCAKHHTKQKIGKNHEICEDIREFQKIKQKAGSFHINELENTDNEEDRYLNTPGKPTASKILSDTVDLYWSEYGMNVDYYQIRYKSRDGQDKWKIVQTDDDQSQITITGLMANTKYVFQVRGVFQDQEGIYGYENDDIQTTESLATHLQKYSILVSDGNPPIYQLLTEEIQFSRNDRAKTKQVVLGDLNQRIEEKTIMLVGATGSGKSTLVDGIVNYLMAVSFDDPFRFTLVEKEDEENKMHNQAFSQTEWITVYKIAPQKGSRLNFTLNIIDTPGFGDTRGIERDQVTIDQIRHLFSETGAKGVLYIDAVCFIVKAPDARLSVSQQYIFSSIMSLFGKDIESNICTLITFADGAEPPVLASLKEANLPFGSTFQFNNSALFADNKHAAPNSLSPMFWEMGCNSFQKFFDKLSHFQTRSLAQTKDVLKEREQLKNVISTIYPQVQAMLSKLSELRNKLEVFKKHKFDIDNNKDFEYVAEETKQIAVKLEQGHHVTNCLICNFTCHDDCAIADDDNKRKCCAMKNGFCTVCIKKCEWSAHKNSSIMYKYSVVKVKKTYTEMKKKYEKAKGLKMTHKSFIEELTLEVEHLFICIKQRVSEMKSCKCRLAEIALRPDPLSTVEYLDLMIQSEETERQPGYDQRIKVLHEFRHMACVDKDFENLNENFLSAKQEMAYYGISGGAPKKHEGFFERGFDYVKELFLPSSQAPSRTQQKQQKEKKRKNSWS